MGLDRSALLRELGVRVVTLPLEIHPEIPVGGISLEDRWGSRYGEALEMYERIEAECAAAGLPFMRPLRVPNTRRALETAEWVRQHAPDAFEQVELALFQAHFVENRPLDDPSVVDEVIGGAGVDVDEARRAVDAGELHDALTSSATLAGSIGVRGTPTWLIARRAIVPGVVPRDTLREAVSRLDGSGASA